MTAAHGQGPPVSTLADVFREVIRRFAAVGDTTEILVGERYLQEEGAPGRIILVSDRGTLTDPPRASAGYIAGVAMGFTAYIWGAEATPDDDLARYDAADALLDRFVNALKASARGRITSAEIVRAAGTNLLTFGEEYQLRATYTRGVPNDAAILAVDVTAVSPPDPDRPNGDTGTTVTVTTTANPSR